MEESDGEPPDDPASGERREVRTTFDRIADHFSKTREHPWPEVASFVADRRTVGVALDVGCGNGRHAELLADVADRVVAVDASRRMLATARERAASRGFDATLARADAVSLPLGSGTVELAAYVATLHHLPTATARRRSLDELARVLAPDGTALVSAWSTTHDRFDREGREDRGFDTTVDWTLPDGETVPRFYHVYSPEEFEADVAASDLDLAGFEVSSGNCYGVVRDGKQ